MIEQNFFLFNLRWCSCSTHCYALLLGFWRWVNSTGACTWCHCDLVREEALVCAFSFAYISDVRQQNNRKADFIEQLYRSYLLRCEWSPPLATSFYTAHNSISAHGKEGLPHCLDELIPLPNLHPFSVVLSRRHGQFLAGWLEHNGSKQELTKCLHRAALSSFPRQVWHP